jgi:hypothetical protein
MTGDRNWRAIGPRTSREKYWVVKDETDHTVAYGLDESTAQLIAAAPKMANAIAFSLKAQAHGWRLSNAQIQKLELAVADLIEKGNTDGK